MRTSYESPAKKKGAAFKKYTAPVINDTLPRLAFDNSLQANILSTASNGKIIMVNSAACKLLGYSKKELLAKTWSAIFNIHESSFKNLLKQQKAEGYAKGSVMSIKKNGKQIPCEITSAVFSGKNQIEKTITTIVDMSQHILRQEKTDKKKEKIVSGNIAVAKLKQQAIDLRSEKLVAENIKIAQAKSDTSEKENKEWIKHISITSYDIMWDWDVVKGQIYVGNSIEEVLGYKVQNNTISFADFKRCLSAEEKNAVEAKLSKTLASGNKKWNDSFMLKRLNGTVASVVGRAIITRDEQQKPLHLIGAIKVINDPRKLESKTQKKLPGKEDKAPALSTLSFEVIWDLNLLTSELIMGEGFEELFGYTLKNYKGNITDWSEHLYHDDKEMVKKGMQAAIASPASHWEHAYRFNRADGSVARVFDKATIIRHTDGKAYRMIGVMQDISRQRESEERPDLRAAISAKIIAEYTDSLNLVFNSSSDILFDYDLVSNKVLLSDGYEKVFGHKTTGNMSPEDAWIIHLHPDDAQALTLDFMRVLRSDEMEWKHSYRFLKADGLVANVLNSAVILRDANGKAYRMIGSMQDISKQTVLEERLEQEIKLKEKQIAEATEDAKDTERSDLGKELHDNVNQLLGASRMYLQMAKNGGKNSEMYLSRASEYTLTAIEEIRKLSKGLTTDIIKNLGLSHAIQNIVHDTMEVNPVKIYCNVAHFAENSMTNKFQLNVFRIVQEQLNNILKHARATEVAINLSQNGKSILLSISDNGVGFDTGKKRTGIGVDNIKARATSYNGTADFVSQSGQGCVLSVTFPVEAGLLDKS
ncbi:PAS domain-containing protein [Agriterribacter sp.]|uniref:sensor histidine kinase n=1 Tax=Agriterribacter sp. TaxID=2821509 RepID=UPI002CDA326E|nr:PAS domain-containing protein [Agriterribacter sp.]HTN07145.1 PAS domain-containing protein [Agriterribacter sp.]